MVKASYDLDVKVSVEEYVVRFEVSVRDLMAVHALKSTDELSSVESHKIDWKSL